MITGEMVAAAMSPEAERGIAWPAGAPGRIAARLNEALAAAEPKCDECDGEGHVEVDTCALCEQSVRATCPKCRGAR